MGNCCERLCPNRSSSDEEAHERQRLLSSPSLSYDAVQPHLTSFTPPNPVVAEQPSDIFDTVTDIIKGVENRVVDAGAADFNPLDNQDYTERSRHYAENVANRPLGPPALPLILPRAFGNPAALIDAPTMSHAEIEMARRIAQINGELYEDMRKQGQEDLIVQFNQTQPPI